MDMPRLFPFQYHNKYNNDNNRATAFALILSEPFEIIVGPLGIISIKRLNEMQFPSHISEAIVDSLARLSFSENAFSEPAQQTVQNEAKSTISLLRKFGSAKRMRKNRRNRLHMFDVKILMINEDAFLCKYIIIKIPFNGLQLQISSNVEAHDECPGFARLFSLAYFDECGKRQQKKRLCLRFHCFTPFPRFASAILSLGGGLSGVCVIALDFDRHALFSTLLMMIY